MCRLRQVVMLIRHSFIRPSLSLPVCVTFNLCVRVCVCPVIFLVDSRVVPSLVHDLVHGSFLVARAGNDVLVVR